MSTVTLEAVRKTVTVDCTVEEAFRIFTDDATSWWPVATHSIHGDAVTKVVFEGREGGELYELTGSGERGRWATVVAWEPPNRLVLSWEVNPALQGTEVEVRFVEQGGATRVDLEHRGWPEGREGERGSYDKGWNAVLESYVERTR
jgi:uncharacterized protein YndB with AHSA1/START domain